MAKPIFLTVEATRLVSGVVWPVKLEFTVEECKTPSELAAEVDRVLNGMSKIGFTPILHSSPKPIGPISVKQDSLIDSDEEIAPSCADHASPMSLSNHQPKKGPLVYFFCGKKDGEEYCNMRGSYNRTTRKTKTWEKKT